MNKKITNKSRAILANNIISMRYEKKWSQEKLAELSNSSSNYICNVETGKRNPSLEFIDNVAKAFGVPISEMLKENKKVKPRVRVDGKK